MAICVVTREIPFWSETTCDTRKMMRITARGLVLRIEIIVRGDNKTYHVKITTGNSGLILAMRLTLDIMPIYGKFGSW